MSLRGRLRQSVVRALVAGAFVALAACPSAWADSGNPSQVLTPPVAAGTSAANIDLHEADRRVMLRWVARQSGLLRILHMRIEAGGADCRRDTRPGYGLGNGGTWHVTTHPVLPDGRPDTSTTLAPQDFRPCAGPASVVDVHYGTVKLAMNLLVTRGQEYATVVRNTDPDPGANFTSTNFLFTHDGLAGANNRNERDPNATDAYYGLDPRELVGFSEDGGRTYAMPGTSKTNPKSRGYLATYIQEYSDGTLAGQPYYCSSPATTTKTMVYPNVPVRWTIRALGAYTHDGGSGTLTLFVDGVQRAQAAVSGVGMIRAAIDPVTVERGQTVKITDNGVSIMGIVADGAWGNLLGMNLPTKKWYLEGEGNYSWAAPIYPLPWYGAEDSPATQPPVTQPPTTKPPTTQPPTTKPPTTKPPTTRPPIRPPTTKPPGRPPRGSRQGGRRIPARCRVRRHHARHARHHRRGKHHRRAQHALCAKAKHPRG